METAMEIDEDKIDDAALALFYLTLHDKFGRAWKQIDWSITDRLYEKGYIHDPVGKSKSVVTVCVGSTFSYALIYSRTLVLNGLTSFMYS